MFDKEFKKAIQNLPITEKDKLILRLLKKDLLLANRLYFELIDTTTVEERRAMMGKKISKDLKRSNEHFYSMGYILVAMRYISGDISEHVRITKDKYGEITLNLQLLIEAIEGNKGYLLVSKPGSYYNFCVYIIARAFKILLLIKALHEDLHMEFKDNVEKLGQLISENTILMKFAKDNGLNVSWLLDFDVPQNIVAIHKEIRAKGLLK